MHISIPIIMLNYFEAFPTHFVDNQYNIPEHDNGVPDFLDEALWGTKLWEGLQYTTGTADPLSGAVMPGTGDAHATYGKDIASTDPYLYTTYKVFDSAADVYLSDNGADITALSAGLFAQASRLLAPYVSSAHPEVQARVTALRQRAVAAWDSLGARGLHYDQNFPQVRYMYAALQLYLLTGENATGTSHAFRDIFETAAIPVINGGRYPEQYRPGHSAMACLTSHFFSYLISSSANTPTAQQLKSIIFGYANQGNNDNGVPFPDNNPYPSGGVAAWGVATAQGRYADVLAFAYRLSQDPTQKQRYLDIISQYSDYDLGLNPMGISYYSGLKEYFTDLGPSYDGLVADEVQSPLHLDSYPHKMAGRGNVPGILVYGPEDSVSGSDWQLVVSSQLYPVFWQEPNHGAEHYDLPPQRRWGDGWSMIDTAEFTTWETIVWNVAMFGFLYDAGGTPPAPDVTIPSAPRRLRRGP